MRRYREVLRNADRLALMVNRAIKKACAERRRLGVDAAFQGGWDPADQSAEWSWDVGGEGGEGEGG